MNDLESYFDTRPIAAVWSKPPPITAVNVE